jgi:inosine-uridine nucleoside N-ribohydrolase
LIIELKDLCVPTYMEIGDPDDVITLCFLTSHPKVNLRAVTVTLGTDVQIALDLATHFTKVL